MQREVWLLRHTRIPRGRCHFCQPQVRERKAGFLVNVLCTVHDLDFIPTGEFDSLRLSPRPGEDRSPSPRSPSPFQPLRSPSPQEINPDRASTSSCPEMVGHMVREEDELNHEWTPEREFDHWPQTETKLLLFLFSGKERQREDLFERFALYVTSNTTG